MSTNPSNARPAVEQEPPFDFSGDTKYQYGEKDGKPCLITSKEAMEEFLRFVSWKKEVPKNDLDGRKFGERLLKHIRDKNGRYLRDDSETYHFLLGGRRIPIDPESMALADFMMDVAKITAQTPIGRIAIEHLKRDAWKQASKMTFRRFSAMIDGEEPSIYLPVHTDGKILRITQGGCELVGNGDNPDALWLEHPADDPMKWEDIPSLETTQAALTLFEKLLVETQACASDSMRWFVAMHEGLFPYIRDLIGNRFILVHLGPSGSGKTSGAQRHTILHGLGDVLGDVSIAALGNMPEQGLIVLDNKEQANFNRDLIDYCLFLATGAARLRSTQDGAIRRSPARSVGVITSIEGVRRDELHRRCVDVAYAIRGDFIGRGEIESAVRRERHKIRRALAVVLREYLSVRVDPDVHVGANPIPRFEEHFTELARLLVAFGRVMGREHRWAAAIINSWDKYLRDADRDESWSPLEQPILQVLRSGSAERHDSFSWTGSVGTLWVTNAGNLLAALRELQIRSLELPEEPTAFGRRLRSDRFNQFEVLGDESGIPELRRTSEGRKLGFFVPAESRVAA